LALLWLTAQLVMGKKKSKAVPKDPSAGLKCYPQKGVTEAECLIKIQYCPFFQDIFMKWAGIGCPKKGKKGKKLGDGGCQCNQYCGYQCESSCNSDRQCHWVSSESQCYNKYTGLPGVPMSMCYNVTPRPSLSPTFFPTKSPTTPKPSYSPTTSQPSVSPTTSTPSTSPTTSRPSVSPSFSPSQSPVPPTNFPSLSPTPPTTLSPTTSAPTPKPSRSPSTSKPSKSPSSHPPTHTPTTPPPTSYPTLQPPTYSPTSSPPTFSPTSNAPTPAPTPPTKKPTKVPTKKPTKKGQATPPPTVNPADVCASCTDQQICVLETCIGTGNLEVHMVWDRMGQIFMWIYPPTAKTALGSTVASETCSGSTITDKPVAATAYGQVDQNSKYGYGPDNGFWSTAYTPPSGLYIVCAETCLIDPLPSPQYPLNILLNVSWPAIANNPKILKQTLTVDSYFYPSANCTPVGETPSPTSTNGYYVGSFTYP